MSQPWVDGSIHSTIYGAKNCQVIKEDISIKLNNKNGVFYARYKIKYIINSRVYQIIPLLFIGIGLSERKLVTVNNISTQIKKYKFQNISKIKFSDTDHLSVNQDDLIYFDAKLNKGKNIIFIEYDADLEYNTQGFVRMYKINYSLYPSKFWGSFGAINIELILGDNLKIVSSNIGEPKIENKTANWVITSILNNNMEIEVTKKTNIISDILLIIQPFGISFIFLLIMSFCHIKILIQKYKQKGFKSILLLGVVIVPILYYVVFFFSFSFIDFALGQESSNHGYVFLFLFTLPILMVVYGITMWLIDRQLKSRYK